MGARVYNTLITFIKQKYLKYGFQEVITPILYRSALWKKSGHWQHFKEDMFFVECTHHGEHQHATPATHTQPAETATPSAEGEAMESEEDLQFGLKPMNCPGHCLIFASTTRSWRDLPIKFADFSPLHRHEASGALRGLTRLRRFVQDDAHIFCRFDQIQPIIAECLQFLNEVYRALGFQYRVVFSTRPESHMGSVAEWDEAERVLADCLKASNTPFELNPGDGAFYGPKIDILIKDALDREHQCGTIQLDFQLPIRFDLSFTNAEGKSERPILIHRAMLGSIERTFAVLIEHYAGKWPFWLSPRQVEICTVSPDCVDYANEVKKEIESNGFFVETDFSDDTLDKRIRNAQLEQFNYILVIGKREKASQTVNVRTRDNVVHGTKKLTELFEDWNQKLANHE